mgnify:FL=1
MVRAMGGVVGTAAAVVLALSGAAAAEEVDLAPKVGEGDAFEYAYEYGVDQQTYMQGNPAGANTIDVRMEYELEIDGEAEGGGFEATLTITRVRLDSGGPMQMVYDTDDPAGEAEGEDAQPAGQAAQMREVVGIAADAILDEPIRARVGPGTPFEVLGGRAELTPTGDQGDMASRMAASLFQNLFGDMVLARAVRPIFGFKTDPTTAEAADSWDLVIEEETNLGPRDARLVVTLREIAEGTALLGYSGSYDVDEAAMADQGSDLKITESEIDGTVSWDLENGRLKSFAETYSIEAEQAGGVQRLEASGYNRVMPVE